MMRTVSIRYPSAPDTLNEKTLWAYGEAIKGNAECQFAMA